MSSSSFCAETKFKPDVAIRNMVNIVSIFLFKIFTSKYFVLFALLEAIYKVKVTKYSLKNKKKRLNLTFSAYYNSNNCNNNNNKY